MGNLLDEVHIWGMQHDMEMLDPMDRLQRPPILEPDDIVPRHSAAKRSFNKVVDLLSHGSRQLACCWVVFELKLGPDDQMDDLCINPVWPIVV